MADAQPVAILTTPEVSIPPTDLPLFSLHQKDAADTPAPISDQDRLSPLLAEHPAYVIYTSGSTGNPKGVVVPHNRFLALLDATIPLFDLGPNDVWTAFHSYAFDFSVWEIWAPLLTGGRTVVVPAEATWSPDELLALLRREGVTVLNQTPSSFAALDRADGQAPQALDALRLVIFGGEALDPARLRGWFSRHPQQPRMVNMYGITETTVHVTAYDIPPTPQPGQPDSPIGQPLEGFQGSVLDHHLRPVAEGETGELFLSGPQVARGYLGRPGLTACRFVADPQGDGQRLYRTGDLVQSLPDGLAFGGRADAQLSLRGFRIEAGEVEAALDAYHGVTASAVAVQPDPDGAEGDQCLVAYLVTTSGQIDERGLRAHLAQTLPAHLVPSHLMALTALPLTPNRKLDRSALPAPAKRQSSKAALRAQLLHNRRATRPQTTEELA
jgi:nonribosomal peptide synthetase DhbF